jgi:hypothetical protein
LANRYDISEEIGVSIFRVRGNELFQNVGNFTNQHGITSQKAWIFINAAVKNSNLA